MTKNDLLMLAGRGTQLHGFTFGRDGSQIDADLANREYLKILASAPTDLNPAAGDSEDLKAEKEKMHKLMVSALRGNEEALDSLNALRIEVVDNVLKAKSDFLSFFEIVTLGEDEQPAFTNVSNLYEVTISSLSQEGKPQQFKVEKDSDSFRLKLENLSSKEVGYRIEDIHRGNIKDVALKTLDIGGDMANKVDRLCLQLLNLPVAQGGCFGAFSIATPDNVSTGLTGAKHKRIYVAHSNIITSHLPSSNDLTVKRRKSSSTGRPIWCDEDDAEVADEATAAVNGFFGWPVLMDIVRYCSQWGDAFSDGRLMPTGEVIVPSIDLFDILFGLGTVGVNLTESDMQKQVQDNGFVAFRLWGVNWKLIPNLTIPSGTCYPKTNKLPGKVYLKPSWDREFVDTSESKNWEKRSQRKAFKNIIINQHRVRALRLTYKETES